MSFDVSRLQAIYEILTGPLPAGTGIGTVVLSNGKEIDGTLSWNHELRVAFIHDGANITWVIDVDAVVAFSPVRV